MVLITEISYVVWVGPKFKALGAVTITKRHSKSKQKMYKLNQSLIKYTILNLKYFTKRYQTPNNFL